MITPFNKNQTVTTGGPSSAVGDARGTSSISLSKLAHDTADEIQAELLSLLREQEKIRKSEARYRDFFDNAKDVIYVHDLTGRYTMVNKAAENLMGYSREELLQMTVFDVIPSDHFAQVSANLKQKLEDHQIPTVYEVEAITKDGRRVPVEVSTRLLCENGVPTGVHGTARDI